MNILHTIAGILEHTGGPAQSVPMLCSALVKRNNKVILATLQGPLSAAALDSRNAGVDLRTYAKLPGQFSIAMSRALPGICAQSDVIHGNGVWLHPNWATGKCARKQRKAMVISPRGSLQTRALEHSKWKKKLAGALFDNKYLRYAACLHAASLDEYESIRKYGLTNPVAIVPNGVDIPDQFDSRLFLQQRPELQGKKIVLFLSRISWEKGLPLLAEAWEKLHKEHDDWHLVIAGAGEAGYELEIKKLFASKGLSNNTSWTGLLKGPEKWSALAAADLFVLPTHSENFGIAVAEALAAGVPVVTTHGAPWQEIVKHECGWWVPVDADSLIIAMRDALSLSNEKRKTMGRNGRLLMESKYSWAQIAAQMESVYHWILKGGQSPTCVRID